MKKIVMSILGITMMACTMVNASAQPQISINMNCPQIGYLYDTPNYHFAYIGNFRSMKLHLSECRYASSISRHNLIGVCDTVKVPTVIVQNSPSHRGNFPIKSGTP